MNCEISGKFETEYVIDGAQILTDREGYFANIVVHFFRGIKKHDHVCDVDVGNPECKKSSESYAVAIATKPWRFAT